MKPEIENLKAWIYGKSTIGYQRALGMREFEKLLEYVAELEQLHQPLVMRSVCCNSELVNFNKDYDQCFVCEKIQKKQTLRQQLKHEMLADLESVIQVKKAEEIELKKILIDYHEFYLKWRSTVTDSSPKYCADAFLRC